MPLINICTKCNTKLATHNDGKLCEFCAEEELITVTLPVKTIDKKDIEHLEWLHERLVNIHGENKHYDYMLKFKEIIDKLKNI